jgi:TonB family protein
MTEVSDVLRDRRIEPAGLQQMATISAVVHAAVLALIVLAPASWFGQNTAAKPVMMTISLSAGTPGPTSGGRTSIGGRAIQTETPADAPRRPEAVRPPAAAAPKMTMPVKGAPTRRGSETIKQAPDEARGSTPTRGAEVRAGSSLAETGARGQGFGLSTGGGAGGSGIQLDVGDFCCPEYVTTMVERIRANWSPQAEIAGQVGMKFTIQRDGTITGVEVEKPSRYAGHNLGAQRALLLTKQLPPLPAAFPNATLPVHLTFEYVR